MAPRRTDTTAAWIDAHRVAAPPVSAEQIVGIGHVLREAASLIARLRHPEIIRAAGADIPRGIVLYGSPGTGKTLTARYMASQLGADVPFFEFSSDELDPERVRAIFRHLSSLGKAVIYVDEIDSFALARANPRHTDLTKRLLTAMLTSLDGLIQTPGILVIASSNTHPGQLDAALMRPGRMGFVITFPLPQEPEREALLRFFASNRAAEGEIDWARAARVTRGSSPAALRQFLDDALGLALMDGRQAIREGDVFEAILRNGVVEAERPIDDDYFWRTAVHEAGHIAATVALRGAERAYAVSIDTRGGRTWSDADSQLLQHPTNVSVLDAVVIWYAGSRAEQQLFGDFSVGAHRDHREASALLVQMMNDGLEHRLDLLAPPALESPSTLIGAEVQSLVWQILRERARAAQDLAARIVKQNAEAIDIFARQLVEERELSGPRLQQAIERAGFGSATHSVRELDAGPAEAAQ